MRSSSKLTIGAIALLAACSKAPVEPNKEQLMSAVPACANDGCKDFEKVSCEAAGDPDGLNSNGEFKCKVTFKSASAAGETKTEDICVFAEGGTWKQKDGICL